MNGMVFYSTSKKETGLGPRASEMEPFFWAGHRWLHYGLHCYKSPSKSGQDLGLTLARFQPKLRTER